MNVVVVVVVLHVDEQLLQVVAILQWSAHLNIHTVDLESLDHDAILLVEAECIRVLTTSSQVLVQHKTPVEDVVVNETLLVIGQVVRLEQGQEQEPLKDHGRGVAEQLTSLGPLHGRGDDEQRADGADGHVTGEGALDGVTNLLGDALLQVQLGLRVLEGRLDAHEAKDLGVLLDQHLEVPLGHLGLAVVDVLENERVDEANETGVGADDEPPVVVELEVVANRDPQHEHDGGDGDTDGATNDETVDVDSLDPPREHGGLRSHRGVRGHVASHAAELHLNVLVDLLNSLDGLLQVKVVLLTNVLQKHGNDSNFQSSAGVDPQLPGIGELSGDTEEDPGDDGEGVDAEGNERTSSSSNLVGDAVKDVFVHLEGLGDVGPDLGSRVAELVTLLLVERLDHALVGLRS